MENRRKNQNRVWFPDEEDAASSKKANAAVSSPTGKPLPAMPVGEEVKREPGHRAKPTSSATRSPVPETGATAEKSLEFIRKQRKKLIRIIQSDPDSVLDESLAQSLITDEDYNNMNKIADIESRIRKLLIQIQKKGESACQQFLESLESMFPGTNQDLQHPQWGRESENRERATALASETSEREVEDEATCPICLEFFTDPVTIDCGHSCCRVCVTTYCDKWEEGNHGPFCCPICRAKIEKVNFRPNWQLAGLVEPVKQLGLKPGKEEKENLCARHQEKLSLFCEDDGEFLCVKCDKSPVHKSHSRVLIKEAALMYKDQICVHLNNLNKKQEKLLQMKLNEERQSLEQQQEIETMLKKIVSEFGELEKILKEQREHFLAQLEELNRDVVKSANENVTKLLKEISFLSDLIKELEEKCQQPRSEFLQDIRSTMNRCEQVTDWQPEEISPKPEENLRTLHQLSIVAEEILKTFRAALNLKQEPETQRATFTGKEKLCPERPKALQRIESKLNIEGHRSRKLKLSDVLEITPESLQNWAPQSTADLPWHFLRKLMALNGTARSTSLDHREANDQPLTVGIEELDIHEDIFSLSDTSTSDSLHPLDVLCAVLLCSDSFLQQEILSKMSMCQFALPLLLPPLNTPRCTLLLWAMRDIVRRWRPHSLAKSRGFREESLVLTQMPTVSFVRLGSCSFSKSQLLNEVLSPAQQHHNFFVHRDMESRINLREIADGLVEIAWYFPARWENLALFPEPVAVTNLRGDIESHWLQFSFLTEISSAVFIITESISERECALLSSFQGSATKYYFILSAHSGKHSEILGLLQKIPKLSQLKQTQILIRNSRQNKAEFVKIIRSCLRTIVKSPTRRADLEHMAVTARELGIQVDEDSEECQRAREHAKEITEKIQDVVLYKKEQLKLQGELWKSLAKAEKEICQMKGRRDTHPEIYKSQLKEKILELRTEQYKCDLTDSMKKFIDGISLEPQVGRYFLKWMKFYLDDIARGSLSKLKAQYKENCKGDATERLAELDKAISDSSLGVEHFMRELGQFYEAECAMVKEGKMAESQRQFILLPGIAADLMLEGFPLELIDGDASNIPLQWVTDVLTELHAKLGGRPRMLVLSVLGGQSTGKSTLLNTMFGLQFTVSSGRCTRGAFMTLIQVAETFQQDLGCDCLLVIDTEGLKAPELAKLEDSYQHDNELATLVIGLSDITIINMAMENATEMKDVLQIAVHAFLRMNEIGQKSNCQFVHQNVSDVSAHDQNMRDRKHLLEQLNEMTRAAARMEKQHGEITFCDIMEYDPEKHNWYIPGLWHGVPPMASVSRGYSEGVWGFKKYLVEFIRSRTRPTRDIPQFIECTRSLWNSVKHENFIFSFRNSLVAEAYNQLSTKYSEWEWSFRKEMHLWVSEKETFIQNRPPNTLKTSVLPTLEREMQEKLSNETEKMLDHLKQYFESEAANLHLVEKYKEDFSLSAKALRKDLERYSASKCEEAIQIQKGRHKVDEIQAEYMKMIEEKINRLLGEFRKKECKLDDKELEKEFGNMWRRTLSELPTSFAISKRQIHQEMETQLTVELENRGSAVNQMLQEAKSLLNYKRNTFQMRKGYIDISGTSSAEESFKAESWFKAEELAKSLMDQCRSYVEKKVNSKVDYDETFCRELLHMINERLKQAEVKQLCTSTSYEVDLKLHILGEAAFMFQKMHEDFIKENDVQRCLEKLKPQYFSTFRDLYQEKGACQNKARDFCDRCLEPALRQYVNKRLGTAIVDDFLNSGQSIDYASRNFFQFSLLKRLLEEKDFESYVKYIHCYEEFVKTWIWKHLSDRYREAKCLGKLEQMILSTIMKKVQDALKSSRDENTKTVCVLIEHFCKILDPDLVISKDSLQGVLFKNTAKSDWFADAVQTYLCDLEPQILSQLRGVKIESKLSQLPVKPHDEIFKRVFGCGKQCPFCKAPCEAGGNDHKLHFASMHWPQGLARYKNQHTRKLDCSLCSSDVLSTKEFKIPDSGGMFHPYKDYQRYYPDWHIQPDASINTSDYWKFVFQQFNTQFAERYHAEPADLPADWEKLTAEKALESIKEAYGMK